MNINVPHNRIDEILPDYWDGLRGARPYPSEAEIDPDAISDIWDSCFLVKATPNEIEQRGFRYTYLGVALIEAFGDDITNQEVSARLIDPSSAPLQKRFEEVIQKGLPVTEEAEFTNKRGMHIKYRTCMLPLGEAANGIDYIIGGMKWKTF